MHVDDIMFAGDRQYIEEELLPTMKESFEISIQYLITPGYTFQFLRRTYEMTTNGLKILPGKYAEIMIEAYERVMDKAKEQKLPCTQEMLEKDGTTYLSPELANLYRSIVGCGIYLSQERPDVSFTIKEFADSMSNPTTGSMRKLGRLIGYLKGTLGQHIMVEIPKPGWALATRSDKTRWMLETFNDSDWSGSMSHRRSTSSAIHMINGMVVLTSSRGQKSVSLNSAEAELNALISAAANGIYLRRCLEFLVEEEIIHDCLVDNSAAIQLSHKRGPRKLRYIDGKFLWIQEQVAQREFNVKAVGTTYNVAHLGIKPLIRARINLILHWCHSYDAQGHAWEKRNTSDSKWKVLAEGRSRSLPNFCVES